MPFYPSAEHFMRLRKGRPEKMGWKKFAQAMSPVITLGKQEYWKKVRGGNDLLPKAFADRLGDKIKFDAPVVEIEQDARRGKVRFARERKRGGRLSGAICCCWPYRSRPYRRSK